MQFRCNECGVTTDCRVMDRGGFTFAGIEYCPCCGHCIIPEEGETAVYTFAPPADEPLDHPALTAQERNNLGELNRR